MFNPTCDAVKNSLPKNNFFDHMQHRTNMDAKILQVLKSETDKGGVL